MNRLLDATEEHSTDEVKCSQDQSFILVSQDQGKTKITNIAHAWSFAMVSSQLTAAGAAGLPQTTCQRFGKGESLNAALAAC